MNTKRILGVVLLIGGVALILVSMYIKNQVEEGKTKIGNAEKQVEQGKSLFSLNPYAKEVGKGVSGAAERKIGAAKGDVAYYEELAGQLQVGGIVLIVLGAGVIFIGGKSRKK